MKKMIAAAIAIATLGACHGGADTTNAPPPDAATVAADNTSAASDTSNRTNPAIAPDQNRQVNTPAAGRNSFTEGQAIGHLTNAGYTNVSRMTQDDKGVWHGTATDKTGKTVAVTVDYQGSVTAQ